jgi:hypothetical protein
MLKVNDAIKVLNEKGKKYTLEQGKLILEFLYQLAEISYPQFNYFKNNEKSNFVFESIHRRAS